MHKTVNRETGLVLAVGLLAIVITALLPAGLRGGDVPAGCWTVWGATVAVSMLVLRLVSGSLVEAARRLGWLLVAIVLLSLPLTVLAALERGPVVASALLLRAFAAAAAGMALVGLLGASGIIEGAAALGLPRRLVEVLRAMLVALAGMHRQIAGMLRARAARRARDQAWASIVSAPVATISGFGRFASALLIRALERAESLERARESRRGGGA